MTKNLVVHMEWCTCQNWPLLSELKRTGWPLVPGRRTAAFGHIPGIAVRIYDPLLSPALNQLLCFAD